MYRKENLIYSLYVSLEGNLTTTPKQVERNGMLVDRKPAMTRLKARGLPRNTTYYFNVVVEDLAGNKAIYNQGTIHTDAFVELTIGPVTATFNAPDLLVHTSAIFTTVSASATFNAPDLVVSTVIANPVAVQVNASSFFTASDLTVVTSTSEPVNITLTPAKATFFAGTVTVKKSIQAIVSVSAQFNAPNVLVGFGEDVQVLPITTNVEGGYDIKENEIYYYQS